MKAFHSLRIAAVVTLLYCAGHTAGMPWTPYTDAEGTSVLDAMKSHHFAAQGFKGAYWDIYFGFGIVISLYMLVLAVALWQVAALAKAEPARVRPVVATFLIAFIINTALAWKYFFVVPVVMSGVIAMCLGAAFVQAGREGRLQHPPRPISL